MKEVIEMGLPDIGQPFSWAVKAGGLLFTTHGPVRTDGTIDTGPIEAQARLTLDNLRRAVHAAGACMDDVAQVLIYMTHEEDMAAIDSIYREFFAPPYPNRSSVVVRTLVVPGMRIEMVAYVLLPANEAPHGTRPVG